MNIFKSVILGVTLLLASCTKEKVEETIQMKIVGKWDWLETYGGFTGNALYTPENTGDERKFVFKKDSSFYEILNSDTVQKTNYFISREESMILDGEFDFLTINFKYYLPDEGTTLTLPMRYMITKIADSLKIREDVYDGFRHKYVKMK
jgi:hypothetical protein